MCCLWRFPKFNLNVLLVEVSKIQSDPWMMMLFIMEMEESCLYNGNGGSVFIMEMEETCL